MSASRKEFIVRRRIGLRWSLLALAGMVAGLRAEESDFFENKVRPILVERCYGCHSADKKQKGNLLLDTREATLKGGDTGPALVAGDPGKSLLIKAVKWTDEDLKMPPKKKLSDEEIATLEEWVKMGAPDPRGGARVLTKIEQHLEDAKKHWSFQPPAEAKDASLDALIGAKPPAPAAKRILLRRAYLDLIGLPPTYAEVQAFLADDSPQAFEKVIDTLLADPRYGERWGRHWLDVARYADNMGSIFNGDDTYPNAFTYRDYVIKAFNEDKPYNRFILEQIAGDQIETAQDTSTLAGMGFLGLGRRKDRKIDDDMLDDTIDVIGRGLLGLSVGCARCHDHKLEPITTKDYYALYSILKSSKEPDIAPALPQADSPQVREYAEQNRKARENYIRAVAFEADRSITAIRARVGDYLLAARDGEYIDMYRNKKVQTEVLNPRRLNNGVYNFVVRAWDCWVKANPAVFGPWLELVALPEAEFASKAGELSRKYAANADRQLLPAVARIFVDSPPLDMRDVATRYNFLFATELDGQWGEFSREALGRLCVVTPADLDISQRDLELRAIDLVGQVDAIPLPDADSQALREVLLAKGSPFVFDGKTFVSNKLNTSRDVANGVRRNATKVVNELINHPGAPARAMTFVDAEKMYDGKVFVRGNPNSPGADAPRQFLTVLKAVSPEPFPKNKSGRLELAQAIASPANPLTARVIVNRVWGWHFGDPIVGTPSDFGFRGDAPTNQPLLDHLATWFMANGWSFKKLHKHLMLSAAYQSASFPMRPLDLEPFRDSLLAVTGRLESAPFGKAQRIDETMRRTLYGFVDRKTQPSLYRSFDFPDPNFTAAKRGRTALTPRALILMNSPLLTESARKLAATLTSESPNENSRIEELYHRVFQRPPTEREKQRARDYLAAYPQNDLVHPESKDWQYGYGEFDAGSHQVKAFASLTAFDGKAFKGALKTADGKTGGIMLDAMGGDSGAGQSASTIRRWIAPMDGEINIAAELTHTDAKTEGVVARIISSRSGQLGEWKAKAQSLCTDLTKITVQKGDTLDFIVSSQSDQDAGAYQWSPSIVIPGSSMPGMPGMAQRWDARVDFADPNKPAKPLTALEELCQALLLSPEFAVLE